METSLKNQLVSKLNAIYSEEWADFRSVAWLVDYIEANVSNQHGLWTNIEHNVRREMKRALKNVRVAEANLLEAKASLEDPDKASSAQTLQLINEAIANCPMEHRQLLAKLFVLRSTVLFKRDQVAEAVSNVQKAVALDKADEYRLVQVAYLRKLGHCSQALALLKAMIGESALCADSDADMRESLEATRKELELQIDNQNGDFEDKAAEGGGEAEEEETSNFDVDFRCQLGSTPRGSVFEAGQDIPEGCVVLREKAYTLILLPDGAMNKCSFCWKPVSHTFWPCHHCNEVVFCDQACFERGWAHSHKADCKLSHFWLDRSKSTFHMFKLLNRLGVKAVAGFDSSCHSPYDVRAYMADPEQRAVPLPARSQQCRLGAFQVHRSLAHHSDKFSGEYTVYHVVNAIECAYVALIMQGYEFGQVERAELISLIESCLLGIRRVLINSFRWSEQGEGDKKYMATCLCLMSSLLNHKCESNCEWVFEDGAITLTTNRAVSKGEELSICYGFNKNTPFEERQKQNMSYYFQCSCTACMSECRLSLALQCPSCPGPVMVNPAVYSPTADPYQEATCLLCGLAYADSANAHLRLVSARQKADFVSKLYCVGTDKHRFLEVTRDCLHAILALSYRKSFLLKDDVNKCCAVLSRHLGSKPELLAQCLQYGEVVDQVLPLFDDATRLEAEGDLIQYGARAVEDEIDGLLLWADLHRMFIETSRSQDRQVWNRTLRFYYRLFKVLKLVIEYKRQQGAENKNFTSTDFSGEADLLNQLYRTKKVELECLKQTYGEALVFK